MKKTTWIFVLNISLFSAANAVADGEIEKDWNFSASIRAYNAERSSWRTRATTGLLGFNAVHKSRFFLSMGAMPELTFSKNDDVYGDLKFVKSDADLNVGYLFNNWIGAAVGVKYISTKTKQNGTLVNEASSQCPNFAVAPRFPAIGQINGFANVAYSHGCKNAFESKDVNGTFFKGSSKNNITTADFGVSFPISQSWSGLTGYRWIRFDPQSGVGVRYSGFTLGVSSNF